MQVLFYNIKKSSFIPLSVVMEVSGSMMVDAFNTQLGLRMRNTLNSRTEVKGRVNFGKTVEFQLDAAKEKLDIFHARYLLNK